MQKGVEVEPVKGRILGTLFELELAIRKGVLPQDFYDPRHPLTQRIEVLRKLVEGLPDEGNYSRDGNNHHQDPNLLTR